MPIGLALVSLFYLSTALINASEQPLVSRSVSDSDTLFSLVTGVESGVRHRLEFPSKAPFDLLTDQTSGAGVAIGDVDGDGLPDLFFTRYDSGNRLYRNLGDWRFEDITESAGVAAEGRWCGGASFVDIDNDGDLDLHVCVYARPNLLFVNRGDGVFDERAREYGLNFRGASVMMSFADYDRDGDLDGYLVTHRLKDRRYHLLPKSTREAVQRGILRVDQFSKSASIEPRFREYFGLMDKGGGRVELIIAGQQDLLFRNDQGKFKVVNKEAGISGFGIGLASAWWDYNDDGWPDLYVSNDYKGADKLYRNQGDGTFREIARVSLPHIPWYSMGSDSADINNDGFVDLLASDMSGTDHFSQKMAMGDMGKNRWFLIQSNPQQYMRNAVFLGTGTEQVMEAAHLTGLANTDWTWSPKFGDFDLDGWVDLFVSNGMSRDFMNSDLSRTIRSRDDARWRDTSVLKQTNLAFRNQRGLSFESVETDWGLDQEAATYGVALGDLDRDGDLDIVTANFGETASLWRNESTSGDALMVQLVGKVSNRWGLGCKLTLQIGDRTQTRVLTANQGFMSSNEPLVHFGFPKAFRDGRLTVEWPSGKTQSISGLRSGRHLVVIEDGEAKLESKDEGPWITEMSEGLSWQHRERLFDDFRQQPLLPARQSQLGPGIAVGDVDGDGDDDLYLGGASGQSGVIKIREGDDWRSFTSPFDLDASAEDMGAVFFDADLDGDQDLYVVSGGVELPQGNRFYQDRLYINGGDGRFRKAAAGILPEHRASGSVVVSCDFDRDGDLDLFVGGRAVPGRYPMAEPNQLLRNEGGAFSSAEEQTAPELRDTGLVTGALWSDVNGDSWVDLILTHHWGPIRVFQNAEGRLIERSDVWGTTTRTGWWNGIAGGDLDRDGDIDYVVTNMGQNTKYHGDPSHPNVIYYGDVDGSGESRIIEAKFEGDICYPVRGKSCSTAAIPSLAGKFKTFERFALASLPEIYPQKNLEQSRRFEVNTLDSMILWNRSGRFEMEALPRLAQIAPGFGVVLTDLSGNGSADLVIAQNDFSPEPETGRMDGGLGLLLEGGANGVFRPVWPKESGLALKGDYTSMVVADFNGDSLADLLVGQNNGKPRMLLSTKNREGSRPLVVRLQGPRGNPTAIGATVSLRLNESLLGTREVYAGSGYLSQSSPKLFFSLPAASNPRGTGSLFVRWPDGKETRADIGGGKELEQLVVYPE